MNIVFVSGHACIRCQKEALPLLALGHQVHMLAKKVPVYVEHYDSFALCSHIQQYIEAIKVYAKTADIFHVHNEPNWFVTAIKEHCDVPVVLDVHDSFLARSTPEEATERLDEGINHVRVITEERNNFQMADALVFPSDSFADLIRSEFKLTQPSLILPSYLPKSMYTYNTQEWLGGLVYEGRIDLREECKKDPANHGFRYTDYQDLAEQAHKIGMDFHLYARDDKPFLDVYEKIAFTHTPQPYTKLMGALSRHDWGLVGNSFATPEWDVAMPNKLFEYVAAGVPVVSWNAAESSRLIEKWGIGITVNSLEELGSRWSEHTKCRKQLLKVRQRFVMENHIQNLIGLYNQTKG